MNVIDSRLQCVTTRYYGPTNRKGARIRVKSQAFTAWISWDYGRDPRDNHRQAFMTVMQEWKWASDWSMGALPDGSGFVFVAR